MKTRALLVFAVAVVLATPAFAQLTVADVTKIVNQAITRARTVSPNSVIAVTDREGNVLAVWVVGGGAATNEEIATAVSKAGTAAYLSSNQNAFTSRSAGFIIQQHFPPGVNNVEPGPLVGVGLSNLFFSDINKFRKPGSVIVFNQTPGLSILPVPFSSLDGTPGGVPLYKSNKLVGGIGVTGDGTPGPIVGFRAENPFIYIAGSDKDEDVALAGQKSYAPPSSITADKVFINGIRLSYINTSIPKTKPIVVQGNPDPQYPVILGAPPPFSYPVATFSGVTGEIRQPIINDPFFPTPINGQARLTAPEVSSIINFAAQRVKITRGAIRLPIGSQMQAFVTVVNNPDMPGVAPTVLGTFRTGEATLFGWDVAVQKARTVIHYSNNDFLGFGLNVAMSVRCVGFLAQCNYPPGINANSPGPFNGQQEMFSGLIGDHCNPAAITPMSGFAPDPELPNGITIFPGSFGLYRNGVLVGAIGISGDGVDQDDIVGASGTHDFLAPNNIRSD
ncbi:MAG: heme-binding protein, partial [Verrucomicrobiota bacterium]